MADVRGLRAVLAVPAVVNHQHPAAMRRRRRASQQQLQPPRIDLLRIPPRLRQEELQPLHRIRARINFDDLQSERSYNQVGAYGQSKLANLNDLGVVQRLTGDYTAAAASHQQALALHRDLGSRLGEVETLNSLGELASQTSATQRARTHHTQALTIAREIGLPLEEARALEGIGHAHLQDGDPGQATVYLRQALAIYQRIGAPAARRVKETLQRHGPPSTTLEP